MTNDQDLRREVVKHMANRFLGWKLPKPFRPDNWISFDPPEPINPGTPYENDLWPTGTNLFDATQAEAMVEYLLDGAALDALIAHHKPGPFTGGEGEVREWLAPHNWHSPATRSGVSKALALLDAKDGDVTMSRELAALWRRKHDKALSLLAAKDAEIARLTRTGVATALVRERDEALAKVEALQKVADMDAYQAWQEALAALAEADRKNEALLAEWNEALTRAEQAEAALADAKQRIDYLEKRLEVVPDWSEDCDGISCRDDTIKLQDERIERLKDALAERDKAMAGVAADLIGYFEEKVPDSPTLNVVRHHLSPFLPKPEVDPLVAKWDAMAAAIKECESKAGPVSPDDLLAALSARNLEVRVKGEE